MYAYSYINRFALGSQRSREENRRISKNIQNTHILKKKEDGSICNIEFTVEILQFELYTEKSCTHNKPSHIIHTHTRFHGLQ